MFGFLLTLFIGYIFIKFLLSLGIGITKLVASVIGFAVIVALFPIGVLSMALFLPILILVGVVSAIGFTLKLIF